MALRVLLLEDENLLRESIKTGLSEHGHNVDAVARGDEALRQAMAHLYDVLVLDIMVPGRDGISLLRQLREANIRTPVLFLTAKTSINDKVEALGSGGDDYLTKPFEFEELLARVNALVRRSYTAQPSPVRVADLEIDVLARRVVRAGKAIDLLPREYELVRFLASNAGQPLTRAMIAKNVWSDDFANSSNVIDVHINRLRSKLDRNFPVKLIHTIRGLGYMLADPAKTRGLTTGDDTVPGELSPSAPAPARSSSASGSSAGTG